MHQKICHESIHTKITFIRKKRLFFTCCYQRYLVESTKNEWEWCSMKVSAQKLFMNIIVQRLHSIKNTNDLTLLFPIMFDIIDETIKIMTCNTQTVTILIDSIIIHFSIALYDYKLFFPYKQNNLTYLVYKNTCFGNENCDLKLKF